MKNILSQSTLFINLFTMCFLMSCSSTPSEERIKEDLIDEFRQNEAIIGVWRYNIANVQINGTSKNQDRVEVLVSFVKEGNYSGGYTRGYEKAYPKIVMFYKSMARIGNMRANKAKSIEQ